MFSSLPYEVQTICHYNLSGVVNNLIEYIFYALQGLIISMLFKVIFASFKVVRVRLAGHC